MLAGCYSTKASFSQYAVNQHRDTSCIFSSRVSVLLFTTFCGCQVAKKRGSCFDSILFLFSALADSFFFLFICNDEDLSSILYMHATKDPQYMLNIEIKLSSSSFSSSDFLLSNDIDEIFTLTIVTKTKLLPQQT